MLLSKFVHKCVCSAQGRVGYLQNTKLLHREHRAIGKLLRTSSSAVLFRQQHQVCTRYFIRSLHTSVKHFQEERKSGSDQNKNDDKNKKDDEEESKVSLLAKAAVWMLSAYIVITMMSLLFPSSQQPDVLRFVSWTEFYHHMLAKGEVEEIIVRPDLELVTIILYEGAIIKGRKAEHRTYHMNIVDVEHFEQRLRQAEQQLGIPVEKGVPLVYDRNRENTWLILAALVAVSLIILRIFKSGAIKTPQARDFFSHLTRAKFTMVDPLTGEGKGIKFADVAGLKEAKQEINEFVDYLKRPEKYTVLGAKIPKGVLLLGPPGCGKTMLAKAVATEASVPFLAMAGSEFVEMIGGLGAARVRDLFKEARKRAPCIIYIDEIDAIGRKRSDLSSTGGTGEEEQTLNQLLVELDGMATKEGVIMLASTNRAEVLDKALLRPGRFDRHILIDLPNIIERREIFEQHLKHITLNKPPSSYSQRLAQLTPGFSGADIANVVNEAALHAAREKQKLVRRENLEAALERVVGGTEKRSSVMNLEEKRTVAVHECGHALVGWMLKHTDALMKVTIVPRTSNALGFAQYLPSEQKLYSRDQLLERMCMALGGRVAEQLTFNKISTGAQDDLQRVTKMAYAMIEQYGLDEVVGHLSFPSKEERSREMGKRPFSKRLSNTIDERVRLLVGKAYKLTEKVLMENKEKLKLLADKLLEREVLNYDDVEALIGPPPHGKKNVIDSLDLEHSAIKKPSQSAPTLGGNGSSFSQPEVRSSDAGHRFNSSCDDGGGHFFR